jgi:hypothetical protein
MEGFSTIPRVQQEEVGAAMIRKISTWQNITNKLVPITMYTSTYYHVYSEIHIN